MTSFKSIKRKNLRTRIKEESDSDGEETDKTSVLLEDLKAVQQLRKRQNGINLEDLGAPTTAEKTSTKKNDPFKLETGGYIDMKTVKKSSLPEEVQVQIGTAFASETNRRDEDTEMLKFVDTEMKKRKGLLNEEENKDKQKSAEDKLYELPDQLKRIVGKKNKKEDMISNQMLSGIPEVDLGIDVKIKNIEQTEEAKQKLLKERASRHKDSGVSDFVPTNYSVNFVQHNRFNIEDSSAAIKRRQQREEKPTPAPLRVGDLERIHTDQLGPDAPKVRRMETEKATDDFHFEKFKKHMRKY